MLNPSEREQILKRYSLEMQKRIRQENNPMRYKLWDREMFDNTRSFMTDSTLLVCEPYLPECRETSTAVAIGPSNIQKGDTLVTVWEFRDQIPETLLNDHSVLFDDVRDFRICAALRKSNKDIFNFESHQEAFKHSADGQAYNFVGLCMTVCANIKGSKFVPPKFRTRKEKFYVI